MNTFNNLPQNAKGFICALILAIIYIIYYTYNNYVNMHLQLKIILVILFFGFIYGIKNTLDKSDNFNILKNNYELSKGTIMKYFVSNLKGGVPSKGIAGSTNYINYKYYVNSVKFQNGYGPNNYVDLPDIKPNLNVEFLVIYEKGNPQNSFILLNYPIISQNDFKKYLDNFKNEIPENVFETD